MDRRRTQEERSSETRNLLLDATIDCLADFGYARTTTSIVAERAGLSRGAQLHHFGNRADLLTAAMDHLFSRRVREFGEAMRSLPKDANVATAAIDLLWKIFTGPTYYAYMELVVAARTDAELGAVIHDLNRRFDEAVDRTFNEFFEETEGNTEYFQLLWTAVLALLGGLSFERLVRPDDPRIEGVVALLSRFGDTLLTPRDRAK